jgi:hypothetical protein
MGRWRLWGAAVTLALLVWLPLGITGLPLDTPDGFLHLGWSVAWVRQLQAGWLWPTWSDLPWAGAGSFALLIYPPLFRVISGLPMLIGVAPDHAISSGLLVILLLNAVGAAALAQFWLRPGGWRWLLLLSAALNPYLWVNLYVRGAWPEALAQALLWWLALGLLGLERRRRWGIPLSTAALAGIVLSNWNAALLTGLIWALAGLGLLRQGQGRWRAWVLSSGLALGLTAPFWLPALLALKDVRPPIPAGLFSTEFFFGGGGGPRTFADLLWIQGLCLVVLLGLRWLGWGWRGWRPSPRANLLAPWGLLIALMGLGLMLPPAQAAYDLLPPLQRIQFPWRWLAPTWLGALLWLCSPGALEPHPARRRWGIALLGVAALGLWADSLGRFAANWVGHAPSRLEQQAVRRLLACDPLQPCPDGVEALPTQGELSKRFVALADGRIALSGVPDYSPAAIPESSWNPRLAIFWLPQWPQTNWAQFNGAGRVEIQKTSPRQRTLRVEARAAGTLRVLQWAHPSWRVQWRAAAGEAETAGPWSAPLPEGGRDRQGWISVPLAAGAWQVTLRYGAAR